jgi:hypothetical protein
VHTRPEDQADLESSHRSSKDQMEGNVIPLGRTPTVNVNTIVLRLVSRDAERTSIYVM